MDDQSVFAYCEKCGIVYALKDRVEGGWYTERSEKARTGVTRESMGTNTRGGVPTVSATTPKEPSGSYWRCPDCDTEIRSDNDSDLEFAKREHIREYHPNRSTGR